MLFLSRFVSFDFTNDPFPSFLSKRIVTRTSAGVFLVVSAFQMLTWAGKKHNRYKKEFGVKYPKSRKAMIPFIY